MVSKPMECFLYPRRLRCGLAAALLLALAQGASAATCTWDGGGANELASNRTNWSGDVAPVAGDHIVLNTTSHKSMTWNMANMTVASWTQAGYNGTVTVATVYNPAGFTNLNITGNCIISNGMWTHSGPQNPETYRLRATIGGDLIIGPAGAINVSSKGYPTRSGPGQWPGDGTSSYGGRGWSSDRCYGSAIAPTNIGSGGRESYGGGAILIEVAGTIRNNGAIRSDAGPSNYGSGSGGSIWLIAGNLVGSGTNSANGGRASSDLNRASGGGRIALVVTNEGADFANFTGTNTAFALGPGGAAGTIYLEKKADEGKGELIINNIGGRRSYAANNTALGGRGGVTAEFSRVVLINAMLDVAAGETLIISNTVFEYDVINNGIWLSGGALHAAPTHAFTNMFIGIAATGSTFSPATSLTIGTNAELRIDKPHEMACDIILAPGGKLTHTANSASETYKLDLALRGNVTVQSGGAIDVIGKGYALNCGPGTHLANYCGASHGGLGMGGLSCYGSIVAPTNLGSGGRNVGAGGGAIIMAVSGTVSNNGLISASAQPVTQHTGAGGSVYITAGSIVGDGTIEANSATNVTGSNPGGGGRISLAVTNASADFLGHSGPITAYGGRKMPSGTSGGAGTVYLREAGQGLYEGMLSVDNNGYSGLWTEISTSVTDTAAGNVFIQNGARLMLNTNQTLIVNGDWDNSVSFTGLTDSAVIFAGAAGSTSSISGYTTFSGFICTNGLDKTILFKAGAMTTIGAGGRLLLAGDPASTNLFLRSMIDGGAWYLTLDPLAAQAVSGVDVKDSDALAGGGAEVIAINSKDRGANPNWKFLTIYPGMEITWTGASSSLFPLRSNWDLDRAPLETDVIVIPAGCDNYPVLDADRTLNTVDIRSGGALYLDGRNLVVSNLLVAGALTASGTETVTLLKDADFTGSSFDAARSTLALAGGDAQALNLAGAAFYKILVENSAAPITFSGGFIATELRCEAPSGTRTLVFEPGKVVRLRDIVLLGSTTSPNIALRSSSPGGAWSLGVSGYRSVRGVDVQDSHANMGLPITATFSTDSGNNVNWVFGAEWSEWLGTINTDFHNAGNWSSGIVPDSKTRVRVESASPMVISWPATVLDMAIGGGADKAAVTANAELTVTENLILMTNGTMTINKPGLIRNSLVVQDGGTLTHTGPQSGEFYKLNLTVYGDVGVDENGKIDASFKGWPNRSGPGQLPGDGASSYGGRGWAGAPCYGSILAPTNIGSGGRDCNGGGAIFITSRGTIRNDGLIVADGAAAGWGGGSGGSIMLRSGALVGAGVIRADGGRATYDYQRSGGGGRISLTVTNAGAGFSGYATNLIRVLGGCPSVYGPRSGGPGTIYYQNARNHPGRGIVIIANNDHTGVPYSEVPSALHGVPGEADRVTFHLTHGATLRLLNDYTLGDIFLETANSQLDLGGHTLTVRAREHSLAPGTVVNYGEIIWLPYVYKGTIFQAK